MSSTPAWLAKWPITWTWKQHRASGSLGGIDYATPVGTKIYAPSAGIVTFFTYSDGSSSIRVTRSDGSKTEFLHGHLVGSNRRQVTYEELIGTTDGRRGAPGAGPSTGPHVHVHDITAAGVRVPPFSTITSSPAGGGNEITKEEDDMNETKYYYKTEDGTEYGIFGAQYPGGFETSTSESTGQAWGKLYGKADGAPWDKLDATVWERLKAEAKVLNERWVAQQRAIYGAAPAPTPGGKFTFTAEGTATPG